jgi:hypothetical protein
MRRIFFLPLFIALLMACAPIKGSVLAANPAATNAPPGVEMAQAVSTITGVAISPLFGAAAVGAWKYYQAPIMARGQLPWFAQPWFWIPALVIVGICALKDVFGMAVPAVFKKPFDVLEVIQHKVSALILIGAFVPLVATIYKTSGAAVPASFNTTAAHGFLAVVSPAWIYTGALVPALILAFFIVFLASNAINILILLSPFPVLDALLKLFRLALLATVVISAFLNPWLGAAWSLLIILAASLIAGWSFRLSHFGMTFIWDYLTNHARRFVPDQTANAMFLGRKTQGVPIRTYGKLLNDPQGNLIFHYHPWLVLPRRTLALPVGIYTVGRGLVYSEILKVEGAQNRSVMLLPPRYRSHEQELAVIYGLPGVRDTGLRAAFVWLKEWLGFRPRLAVAAI